MLQTVLVTLAAKAKLDMGSYGAQTIKPTILVGNAPWLPKMSKRAGALIFVCSLIRGLD
jgi:hypothetical protein